MTDFEETINADINWRQSELASIRTMPFRYKLSVFDQQILIKYLVTAIYALWEGYVKKIFQEFIKEINKRSLSYEKIDSKYIEHTLNCNEKTNLEVSRVHSHARQNFINEFLNMFNQPAFPISTKIPTESNVDFKVLNKILNQFNLAPLDKCYKVNLEKLLWYRNSIAHGDNALHVAPSDNMLFANLVKDLMVEVFCIVNDGLSKNVFLKRT